LKPKVVIGFVGTQLDSGVGAGRWEKWRPTVSLTQHEDMLIDRMVLLYDRKHTSLAEQIKSDIASVSPETEVAPVEINITDPWDFGEVYAALFDFAAQYPFDTEHEDY
jgi:transcriptional regulatory protein RtcR